MNFFYAVGRNASRFFHSFILFFAFIGHVCHSLRYVLFGPSSLAWINLLKILYNSGTAIVIPLIVISALSASALGLNIYFLLEKFNLQTKALPLTQQLLTKDLLPLLIGLILCVQASLNLIIARIKITKFRHSRHEVIINYILPIMIGTNMTALLLYAYMLTAALLGLFYTFHYHFNLTTHEYMIHIIHAITITDLVIGSVKALLFGTIVSLTAGYYYYQAATINFPLRTAVSRILTRGTLWLALISVLLRFLFIK